MSSSTVHRRYVNRGVRCKAVLVAVSWLMFASPTIGADRAPAADDRLPEGLSASDWASIRAAYGANRHAAFAVEDGYQARNPGQQWRTRFDGRGFETTPDAGGWSWGLELVSYGCSGAERAVGSVAPAHSRCGQRVEYDWDETLTEWYVNDSRGLEHGYTVHQRPEQMSEPIRAGSASARRDDAQTLDPSLALRARNEAHLQFTLAVRGDLRPRISGDGRNVAFVNEAGAAVVNFNGLTVFDANGASVPAWFEEVIDSNGRDAHATHKYSNRRDARTTQETPPANAGVTAKLLRLVVDDSAAVYPLTIDPIAQQAYLKASNVEASDNFGSSVAVSGDTVVVGALMEDSSATGVDGDQADNSATSSGAAYVFVRSGGVWSQQAYLKASNTNAVDFFGYSVAISSDTVVIGAIQEDSIATGVDGNQADNSANNSGAAYVFVRSDGVWSQQAYLKASNTDAGDNFGISVAVSGDTIVVGAHQEDSNTTGVNGNQADNSAQSTGAVYVFVRSGGVWSQQAYLKASNTGANDLFGISAAVSGDTVVVGAFGEDSNATGIDGNQSDNSASSSGAAYVFVRDAGVWSQQAYLKASNTDAGDQFGISVAVSGNTIVIGAWQEGSSATGVDGNQADNSAAISGAAYVFIRSGIVWSQEAYLKASNTGAGDQFGVSVAVSGETIAVGARFEDSNATGVNGNQADNSASQAGAAYVFVRSGNVWSQQAYLKASNTAANDNFGFSVAVSGDTVVVGANGEDNIASNSGATYVFTGAGPPCCPGDMNADNVVDALDIQPFVEKLLSGGVCP